MKVMFKQSFKNMGYCWLMSGIVKNSFFLFEGKGLHHMMNTQQMFCYLFLFGSKQYIVVTKKIVKFDGGIRPEIWTLARLDGRWFGEDRFWLTKKGINFNAMHTLNSFRVTSLLSNFLYTIKKLTRATSNRLKTNEDWIETWIFDQVGILTSADPSSQLHPFCFCTT